MYTKQIRKNHENEGFIYTFFFYDEVQTTPNTISFKVLPNTDVICPIIDKITHRANRIQWGIAKLFYIKKLAISLLNNCLLYTSPSPRDATLSRMPSSA